MRTTAPLILASASPRRKALLSDLGFAFEVMVRPVEENIPEGMRPSEVAEHLAHKKAIAFADLAPHYIVLTADTIVVSGTAILGKPRDRREALDMLAMLSGSTHEVITGVCLYHGAEPITSHEVTEVRFAHLLPSEMEYYVDRYKPFDKAGAYGIQEWIGMAGILGINGDFYNVMGLPTRRVWEMMRPWVLE